MSDPTAASAIDLAPSAPVRGATSEGGLERLSRFSREYDMIRDGGYQNQNLWTWIETAAVEAGR
jgi:hypothetical protein